MMGRLMPLQPILQQYAERDKRVKPTFLKENTGLAHARNVALRQATGEYVCFVDSDDWLATDALEKVYDTFEDGVDTVLFSCCPAFYGRKRAGIQDETL